LYVKLRWHYTIHRLATRKRGPAAKSLVSLAAYSGYGERGFDENWPAYLIRITEVVELYYARTYSAEEGVMLLADVYKT
jgi:hypothetical protein